jgi:hypothetical protein
MCFLQVVYQHKSFIKSCAALTNPTRLPGLKKRRTTMTNSKLQKSTFANTDNKGKLLVMVFATCSCYQDSFVTGNKPGPLHCYA